MAEQLRGDTGQNRPDAFVVDVVERDGVVVVSFAGELDIVTVPRAALVAKEAVARGRAVILDMTGLTFFSSAGLTLLVQLNEQRRDSPVDIRLVADQRVVILPLELVGLRDLFPIHTSLDEALAAAG
jgi:anti-anti-sigma factor